MPTLQGSTWLQLQIENKIAHTSFLLFYKIPMTENIEKEVSADTLQNTEVIEELDDEF